MKKFNDLFTEKAFNKELSDPSVAHSYKERTLFLRFDSKDIILNATYSGNPNPWYSSLCAILIGKSLTEAMSVGYHTWEDVFKDDQSFWDYKQEIQDDFLCAPLELLKVTLDSFRGRDYLYEEASPLVCRCFGIRESDILEHLQENEMPTLESLTGKTKAGMGCRSCVPQLKRWVLLNEKQPNHHYKDKAVSEWILEIDYMLSCFPEAEDFKMEVQSFKNGQVQISFNKDVTQKEEEALGKKLQDFLGRALDTDLAFFLRRARHFSKANG